MNRTLTRTLCVAPLALAAAVTIPAPAQAAERFYTATPGGRILSFQSDKPGAILSAARVSGLEQGEQMLAIDVRPATQQLYAVTNRSRVVQINPETGQARPLTAGPFAPPLGVDAIGLDFNPVVDTIRAVTRDDLNLRLNAETGQTAVADPNLRYADGDPAAGVNPYIAAVAYTQPFPGATSTRLYGIDSNRGTLVTIDPANAGTVRTVAPLTVGERGTELEKLIGPVGFDISESGRAFITGRFQGERNAALFSLNVQTGRVRVLGPVGPLEPATATAGVAAAGAVPDDERAPDVVLAAPARQLRTNVLREGVRFELSCSEACVTVARLRVGDVILGRGAVTLNRAGKGNLRFTLSRRARAIVARTNRRLVMQAVITDFAGNVRRQSENISLR